MASGYIGKISAVVTANTSDLTKKLADAGNDTKRFSENLNRSISSAANSAQNSLQKIFTPLQNIERRLQTSLKIPGLDLPLDEIRQAVSITEQLNKPLAGVREGFSRLSLNVQAAFLPALQGAQDEVVRLNLLLQNTGNVSEQSLERARLAVEKLAAAQARLQQAEQIAGRGKTGRELQFTDPRAYESLNRTAQLTQRAGSLPAAQLADGSVAKLVRELDRLQQVTQRSQAQLESLRLSPNVDTSALADAERRLERVIALARITQDQLESALTPPPSDTTVTDEEIKALIEKERRAKSTEEQIYAAKKQIIDRETQDLIDKERRAKQTEENIYNTKKEIIDKEIADLIAREQRAKQVESLSANNRSARFLDSFGGGAGGLSAAFDERAIQGYSAQLQVLQAAISKVSSEARGPAYTAFLKLRDAIANAMDRGELETEQTRQELKGLTTDAVNATAAVAGVNAKALGNSVSRAGDVGRAGFDKLSLALNQAAFAVDDFLSSTGGLEFKLRAVQNNITQLAFIVGNTKGLFVALGAVIATQLSIGILKATGLLGEQRDVLDALNDAFSEQQQRVAALSDAYDRLGDSIRDAGLNEAGRTQAGRQRDLENIRREEENARVARAAAVDPEVNSLRVKLAELQRRVQESDDASTRVKFGIDIARIEAEIARRSREAGQRESSGNTVLETVIQAELDRINTEFDLRVRNAQFSPLSAAAGESVVAIEAERRRALAVVEETAAGERARRGRGSITDDLERQREVLLSEMDSVQEKIDSLAGAAGYATDTLGTATAEYQSQLEALTAEYAALEARIRDAAPGAAFVRFVESLYGVADTLDRARANLDTAGLGRSLTGDALAAVNESLNRRREQAAQARAEGNTELLDALTADIAGLEAYALELESAANATQLFAETLRRVSGELNETVAKEAQSRADAARREANAAVALPPELRTPGQRAAQFERDAAEREARRAEQQRQEVERQNLQAVQQFNERAMAGEYGADIQALVQEREQLQRDIESGRLSAEKEQQARQRRAEIDSQLNRRFEDTPEGRAARQRADEADTAAARARQQAESRARGRDLLEDPAAKAARGVVQSLADIDAAFQAQKENQAGLVTPRQQQQFDEARARVLDDARRQAAPALFALQDAVANAVLQGPSRQALNAADITTQQGTAELNRLLRGDDSARDQNLLELQKQTAELEKLNANLGAAGVAD